MRIAKPMKAEQFAAAGSCESEPFEIYGTVSGTTFKSDLFSGTMDSQKFWDDLMAYAKSINKFVRLMY